MISGAANDSEPHRVSSRGASASIKRDRPKSVSLIKGDEVKADRGSVLARWGMRGWVSRISTCQCNPMQRKKILDMYSRA